MITMVDEAEDLEMMTLRVSESESMHEESDEELDQQLDVSDNEEVENAEEDKDTEISSNRFNLVENPLEWDCPVCYQILAPDVTLEEHLELHLSVEVSFKVDFKSGLIVQINLFQIKYI